MIISSKLSSMSTLLDIWNIWVLNPTRRILETCSRKRRLVRASSNLAGIIQGKNFFYFLKQIMKVGLLMYFTSIRIKRRKTLSIQTLIVSYKRNKKWITNLRWSNNSWMIRNYKHRCWKDLCKKITWLSCSSFIQILWKFMKSGRNKRRNYLQKVLIFRNNLRKFLFLLNNKQVQAMEMASNKLKELN